MPTSRGGELVPVLGPLTNIFLPRARAAGVRGVICLFEGLSDELARDQVLPFTTPYADLPALGVGAGQAAPLRAARSATLVLEAALEEADTDTLHAILPGRIPMRRSSSTRTPMAPTPVRRMARQGC